MYPETWAKVSWGFVFVGFNVTFLPQFMLGRLGMPRRYHEYAPHFAGLNQLSTVGSWMLGVGFLIMFTYFLWSLKRGAFAPANPWGGKTLEWQTASPPPTENFHQTPTVTAGPYEYGLKAMGT